MQVFKNNVSLEATPTGDTHIVNKAYLEDRISKINVQHAVRVDELPICTDNGDGTYTISYVKDGTAKTTTDTSQWFYYLDNNSNLKQTIFLDGEELTIDGAEIVVDDFIEKSAIVTTLLDDTVTNEQVVSAKIVHELTKGKNLKTYTDYPDVGIDKTNFTLEEVATKLNNASALMVGTDNKTPNIFPKIYGHFIALRKSDDKVKFFFFPNENGEDSSIYFCGYHPRIGVTEWKRVCTTSVPDVETTTITSYTDSAITTGTLTYRVMNGICYVDVSGINVPNSGKTYIIYDSMPKCAFIQRTNTTNANYVYNGGLVMPTRETSLKIQVATPGTIYGSFSYPVAEDWRP